VRIKWNLFQVAVVTGLAALGMGCGGMTASGSVSPATFLLPGLGHNDSAPQDPSEIVVKSETPAVTVVVAE